MIQIVKYPDPILLQESEPAGLEEARNIVALLRQACEMQEWGKTMGMAAPQIGFSKRVFVALGENQKFNAYINPLITWRSPRTQDTQEGCYSLEQDRFDYPAKRSLAINMEWQDEHGIPQEATFTGYEAKVIQHEYEHLLGRLVNGAYGSKMSFTVGKFNLKKGEG